MNILLTQSRSLIKPFMIDRLEETVDEICQNNLDLTNETQSVIVGDAPGGDKYIIELVDLLNTDNIIIPISVFGAYRKIRNRTKTGKNYVTDKDYLYRDNHMASLCDKCIACWNGYWKDGIIGRSGTVTTAKYCYKLKKPVNWTFVNWSFE